MSIAGAFIVGGFLFMAKPKATWGEWIVGLALIILAATAEIHP